MSNILSIFTKEQLQLLLNTREGEVKLGERIQLVIDSATWEETVESSNALFVLSFIFITTFDLQKYPTAAANLLQSVHAL